ncbi:PLP-dependent aminotransferase family protein [Bosea caraganae]|uniref:PLP-dependent aminotransferase family protein n=1 Tax=Bosea caraganae TaxID=2763117 RepID=A0A370L145_9HYPH|nr:PLP-dependent aminotransferase family protein [Bosea caraganae]RDJ20826.1 PLP-dependent aminotransferase family protein [Bosea caraganae]RDJ21561.1 PLP-dependent aminotransferase family protein [Bosea caraganae]
MAISGGQKPAQRPARAQWLDSGNSITQQFMAIGGRADIVSLAGGLPAAELYPVEAIARASERALARWGSVALEYGSVEGLPALRAAIAERISASAGRRFGPENVLLTTGAMQGLDLLGKALIDPGDLIVNQFPTYLGALDAWRPRQPRYERLDWSGEGPGFEAGLRQAKFVYAVPNYSNPTGVLVSQARRAALLDKVLEAGTWLVEDDPYLPLQLDGAAGPSILALHGERHPTGAYDGPVIYLGTLSKSLVPGLRVGWVVAEAGMIATLALAKQSTDISSSMFTQAVALELIESGFEAEHIPRIVAAYRERRDALCAAAAQHLSEWFSWEVPPGGMFVWMRAKSAEIDTNALYACALEEKVAFVPSSVFDPDGRLTDAMRVNFTRSSPEVITEGVRRLERAVQRYLASKAGRAA